MAEIKPEQRNGKKQGIRYSEEYRMNAAKMVLIDGSSARRAAASLGCTQESVRIWVKKYRSRILPTPQMTAEEENRLLSKKNSTLQMELDFIKIARGVLCERVEVKYVFIRRHKGSFPVKMMCRLLEVSKSGYYKWLNAVPSQRALRRERLAVQIKEIYEKEHRIPGQRKIYESLRRNGEECSLGLVRRICRKYGIYSRTLKRKRFKPHVINSKHSNYISKNVLNRDFVATKPNEKWLTDITYIEIKGKFVYLSAIIDLYSRRVISWIVSHDMKIRLVVDTLKQALQTRKGVIPEQIIFHSDRGVQYTSEEFRQELEKFGITQSMSYKGECWDNAPCESFWGKLKREWLNHYGSFESTEQVRLAVFEYIEGYYYNKRLHEGLGYRTPREVEEEYFNVR